MGKKAEKRKQQNDQVDKEMLKLRAALKGKLRSNGLFGSTVSEFDKAHQKRQKLANGRKLETFDDADKNSTHDEFYKQVKQKREAKRDAKAEIYSRKPTSASTLPEESVEGKRLISNEMYKNRGLTRYRNKALKNPRKKYRENYKQKLINRKGQVRDIRKPLGPSYGGECSGINPYISRSIRFKN